MITTITSPVHILLCRKYRVWLKKIQISKTKIQFERVKGWHLYFIAHGIIWAWIPYNKWNISFDCTGWLPGLLRRSSSDREGGHRHRGQQVQLAVCAGSQQGHHGADAIAAGEEGISCVSQQVDLIAIDRDYFIYKDIFVYKDLYNNVFQYKII